MAGFYLMHRGWLDHPVFGTRKREPFCRAAAWAWMIQEAAYEPTKARIAGKIIELQRGQLSHSLRFMAEAWGWHRNRVARFLDELQQQSMIETQTGTTQLIITICNYELYQSPSQNLGTANGTQAGQQRDSSGTDLKEVNNTPSSEANASSALDVRARDLGKAMVEVWRAECGDILAVPARLDQRRIAACNARWRDSFGRDIEQFRAYCHAIRGSPFCCGDSERGWRADFDWALTPKAIRGVQEGKYEPRHPRRTRAGAVDNLIEGFGRAAGLGNGSPDSGPDWSSAGPLLDGEYARFDA